MYTFTPIKIVIHWYIRLRSWLIAQRDKRSLYKQFTSSLHLDKLKKENVSFSLPKSYLIATNEISYLYNVRDRIIPDIHNQYATKQKAIDKRLKELKDEYTSLKKRRVEEKAFLDRIRVKAKSVKTSDDRIAMASRVSEAKATLDNTDSAIAIYEEKMESLAQEKKTNYVNWSKQITIIEDVVEVAISRYIKNATKKIELAYGFTGFTHQVAKYDTKKQPVIKGEYRDEKNS